MKRLLRSIARRGIPLALLPALACTGRDANVPGASPVEVVSAATSRGASPMFLVTDDGRRVLSWVADDSAAGREALFVQVQEKGEAPAAVATIRDSLGGIEPHGEAPPQLAAAPDGPLYALYTVGKEVAGERFPRSALRFVRSDDRGRTWTDPITVNEGEQFGSNSFHALLAGPGGAVYASWLSSVKGKSGVWLRRSTDGGRTWLPARAIDTTGACPCCRTGLALGPGGSLFVSWRKVFPGDVRDVVVMRSPDGGESWDAPVRPRDDGWVYPGCPHAGPSLKVDQQGTVHIAWWTGKEGAAGVYYARSTDGGRRFEPATLAVAARSMPAHVQLVPTQTGGALVAWDDGLSKSPRILLRASADGRTFGSTVTVSERGAATFPVVGLVGDSVLVAWSQVGEEIHHAAMAARPNMSDPKSVMKLPRVGQSEILERRMLLTGLLDGK